MQICIELIHWKSNMAMGNPNEIPMVKFVHGKIIEAPKNPRGISSTEKSAEFGTHWIRQIMLPASLASPSKVAQENGTNELPIFTERVAILNLDHLYRVIMSNHFYLPIFTYIYLLFTYIYLYLPIFTYIYLYLPIKLKHITIKIYKTWWFGSLRFPIDTCAAGPRGTEALCPEMPCMETLDGPAWDRQTLQQRVYQTNRRIY